MIFVTILSGLIALASVSTKTAGAAWLSVVLFGASCIFKQLWVRRGDLTSAARIDDPVNSAAATWLLFVTLAFVLKAVAVLYWDSGWEERHGEVRLFLGAVGIVGLASYAICNRAQTALVMGLCGACLAAFTLVVVFGGEGAPTNRIPWASGLSLLILASLGAAFTVGESQRVIVVLSSGLATLGIIAFSGTRGAYPVGAIWIIALGTMLMTSSRKAATAQRNVRKTNTKVWLILVLVLLATLVLWPSRDFYNGAQVRAVTASTELSAYIRGDDTSVNTSIGARLHMWTLSIPVIVDNLPWGIGKDERLAQIQRWGAELNSPVIKSLGHLHNEYLQTLLENGLFGLASFLSYAVGLLLVAKRLWNGNLKVSAQAIVAITAMHSLAEVTNMNFAHNYYPTLLSLSVTVTLLFARIEAQQRQPSFKTT